MTDNYWVTVHPREDNSACSDYLESLGIKVTETPSIDAKNKCETYRNCIIDKDTMDKIQPYFGVDLIWGPETLQD